MLPFLPLNHLLFYLAVLSEVSQWLNLLPLEKIRKLAANFARHYSSMGPVKKYKGVL